MNSFCLDPFGPDSVGFPKQNRYCAPKTGSSVDPLHRQAREGTYKANHRIATACHHAKGRFPIARCLIANAIMTGTGSRASTQLGEFPTYV